MWLLVVIFLISLGVVNLWDEKFGFFSKFLVSEGFGLIVFTQLLLFLSFIFGINFKTIIASLFIFVGLTVFFNVLFKQVRKIDFGLLSFKEKLKKPDLPIVFFITCIVVVSLISYIWFTQALAITPEGFKTGGGGLYGDSALHAAYIARLETGEFPPQNPLFAGTGLVYPFANDLLSAALQITGLNLNLAFSLPQIFFLIGFLVLFYKICRKFTSDGGFLIALLLLLLGWGVGGFFFLKEWVVNGRSLWQFLTFDSTEIASHNLYFKNILTGLVLPERSFLPGLFLGLIIFYNFLEYFEGKKLKFLILNGIIIGALSLWHTHTSIFFLIFSMVFSVWIVLKDRTIKILLHLFLMYIISFFLAVPFLVLFFSNHTFGSFIHFSFGWQNGTENLLLFWLKNSFLVIPLAILGFIFIKREQKVLFVPSFIVFIAANIIIFQPWDWDNIKLLSWSFLFFVILAAIFLTKYIQKSKIFALLIFLVVFISCISGILSVAFQLKNRYVIYDKEDISLANWIKNNTNVDDIFAIEPTPNNPVPGLSGRLVFLGYPGHLWVHGINYSERENINSQILSGNFSLIKSNHLPISYVVAPVNSFSENQNVKEVFRNQKYQVLKII